METLMVFFGGLAIRLLLFLLLFAIFATPFAVVLFAVQGAGALRARAKGTVDAGGVHWKPGLAYTPAHAWVKPMWGRTVKVGLDDLARRVLSGVSDIVLPPAGTRLRRGEQFATVRSGTRLVPIPSPVDGVVIARNLALGDDPSLFERQPYGDGWLLRLESDGGLPEDAISGRASRRWLGQENGSLNRILESRLGLAAADGGELMAPPAALLSDDTWSEVLNRFLRAA